MSEMGQVRLIGRSRCGSALTHYIWWLPHSQLEQQVWARTGRSRFSAKEIRPMMAPAKGHAGTTYGNLSSRRCLAMDGFSPEGTAMPETRDSIASGALSAIIRPLRAAKLYVAGVPTT